MGWVAQFFFCSVIATQAAALVQPVTVTVEDILDVDNTTSQCLR